MKKLILLGPPGAGKGTQADLICSYLSIPKISTGDMLREAIASGNELGKRVSGVLNSGSLVSDEIIGSIIVERIKKQDCQNGFLFDGVPRTLGQANLLVDMNVSFSHVVEISVENQVIIERMSGRRFHIASGRSYHVDFNPPKNIGFDDITGDALVQREDDKPETVTKRLDVYHEETKPLSDFYSNKSSNAELVYFSVDGSGTVESVFESIKNNL
ncbi:adenylate kinase [Gammaproteobacteria bacterium]|nr:adenylate kinase [Gammaproteobacteria bacterium]MDB4252990.1 adenylate kinase [Gammaproteobacteria bacterium]|tara:strand:- start:498 stop:1142 length:645 start_codon:yes stop_codon:yes gene_type:complete